MRREIEHVRGPHRRARSGAEEAAIFDAHLLLLDDADLLADVKAQDRRRASAPRAPGRTPRRRSRPSWRRCPTLPAGARGRRPRGRRAGAPRADRQTARRHDRRRRGAGRRRPHPGRGRRRSTRTGSRASSWPPAARPRTARSWPGPAASRRSWRPARECSTSPTAPRSSLDGGTGELHVDPSPDVLAEFERAGRERWPSDARGSSPLRRAPAVTARRRRRARRRQRRLGRRRPRGAAAGADRAGLVRTEFLFLGRSARAGRRRAGGGLPRDRRGAGRAADHAAHARRRRRQAAALPADAGRGQPVPRLRGIRLASSTASCSRPAAAIVPGRATTPGRA